MTNDLISRADQLHEQANEIVREYEVEKYFSILGQVHFIGSFPLNLMYRPDIDIAVTSENPTREKAVELVKQLLDSGKFQTVGFADCFTFEPDPRMRGFYFELRVQKYGKNWKVDVWHTTKEEDDSIEPTARFKELLKNNPSARSTILELKKQFYDGEEKYKEGVSGSEIYKAVLENRVKDAAGLRKFIASLK